VGLAGAWVALAGQARRWHQRAALGALGAWWLLLAEPAAERALALEVADATAPRAFWEGSTARAAEDVLAPLATGGGLVLAAVWALGAVVLPWLVRGRAATHDVVAAAAWTAGVAAGAQAACLAVGAPAPRNLVPGAIVAALLAVAARAAGGPR
jgi:hypothetical protein